MMEQLLLLHGDSLLGVALRRLTHLLLLGEGHLMLQEGPLTLHLLRYTLRVDLLGHEELRMVAFDFSWVTSCASTGVLNTLLLLL